MSKPRMYGSVGRYTPNNSMDMRRKKKIYQHGRKIAERDMQEIRERAELKEMEERKHEWEERKTEKEGNPFAVCKRIDEMAHAHAAALEIYQSLALEEGQADSTERSKAT